MSFTSFLTECGRETKIQDCSIKEQNAGVNTCNVCTYALSNTIYSSTIPSDASTSSSMMEHSVE